ncbi:MAG: energy transducer TonB [Chitinophagaceae bacterium]
METNKILSAPLIDVIFDGRNKEYGAYELRKTYSKRINKALLVTTIIAALVFGGAVLASSFGKKEVRFLIKEGIKLSQVPEEKIPEKIPEPERQPEPDPVKTLQFTTPPKIKPDDEVVQPPPSQEDLVDVIISDQTREGIPDDGISRPDKIDDGKGIIPPRDDKESDEPFTTVEIDAKFNGNWKAFLERNLNPEVAREHDAPPGRYSVVMQFVVDLEGKVSEIKALTDHGYGLEQEAIRVLRKAAKWEPAIQNGRPVKAYRRQVIIFEVPEE